MHLNQGGGHWEIGLAAKLHDSTLHGGDYDADRESQRIQVTSEIIKEEHVSDDFSFRVCGSKETWAVKLIQTEWNKILNI